MSLNSESIYGCGSSTASKPEWGRITQKGHVIYAHWMYPIIGHINIPEIAGKVKRVTLLSTGAELPTSSNWWGNTGAGNFFINVNSPTYHTFELPDKRDTVIKIELK
jgi:alpha-L-fucosidase